MHIFLSLFLVAGAQTDTELYERRFYGENWSKGLYLRKEQRQKAKLKVNK